MKRQPIEWKKMFDNDPSNKMLISKIYEELIQLNTKNKQPTQLKGGQRT